MARTAAPASLTSIQRSPAAAIQGGRRSTMKDTAVFRAAAAACCEMMSAYGCVASINTSTRSATR